MLGRQPRPHEARAAAAVGGVLSLLVFALLCYPELRKNLVYLPATCQPYSDGVLRPEIKPYRHCRTSCFGCMESWNPTPCSLKMGMHLRINEYDMDAMRYLAGSCGGSPCCAQEVCNTCTRHETRCSRRRLFASAEPLAEGEALGEEWEDADWDGGVEGEGEAWAPALRRQLRRRLESKSCRQVSTSYKCNCKCVRSVRSKLCSFRCEPFWRSFVPVRLSVARPASGFFERADDPSPQAALQGYRATMARNQTPSASQTQAALANVNHSDADQLSVGADQATEYALPGFGGGAFVPMVHDAYSRVATLVYEHGASRGRAMHNLMRWEFAPGVVSECYYEPGWDPHAPFLPSHQVAFADEMGYALWKWLLLAVCLALSGLGVALWFRPALLGGEAVVASVTVLHTNQVVVGDNTFKGVSMH